MRHILMGMLFGLAMGPTTGHANEDILLRGMGSFHVGGRLHEVSGQPVKQVEMTPGVPARVDPNGFYQVEQMYVQYFLPRNRRGKLPLLLWHGGGLTGVTYETTPDGREGWLNIFLRKGWDVYNSDAVERGRSGWPMPGVFKGEPTFLTAANPFERFRIGDGAGSWNLDSTQRKILPANQFPVEAYDSFVKQGVPRWFSTDEIIIAAYIQLVDKICPCVVLVHSQSGRFGFKVAEARPDKIKALIAVEPTIPGDRDKADLLKNTPVLMIFGDYIKQDPRWTKMRQNDVDYVGVLRTAGGSVDVFDLPELGLKGNSHMVMMDKNSAEVAELIQKWLVGKELAQ